MIENCFLCKTSLSPSKFVFLKDNIGKFENLLETSDFDPAKAEGLKICLNCNQLINKYFKFKCAFVEKEVELLNYVNSENTVDLYEVLVSKGLLVNNFGYDKEVSKQIVICRMCYKFNNVNNGNFIEITYGSKWAAFIQCVAEFDLLLLNKTFICPLCHNTSIHFNKFLLLCMETVKKLTEPQSEPSTSNLQNLTNNSRLGEPPKKKLKYKLIRKSRGRPPKKKLELPSNKNNTHPEGNFLKLYECLVCLAKYGSDYSLSKHIGEEHSSIKNVFCTQCPYFFTDSLKLLSMHLKEVHDLGLYRYLGRRKPIDLLSPKELYSLHPSFIDLVTKNLLGKPIKYMRYECEICPAQCDTIDEIKIHIDSHFEKRLETCWICNKSLGPDEKRHFESEHETVLYNVIEEIDEYFLEDIPTSPNKFELLQKEKEENEKNKIKMFECQLCLRHIEDLLKLHEHISFHINSKRFTCFDCNLHYGCLQEIRHHLASKHSILYLYRIIYKLDDDDKNSGSDTNLRKGDTQPISDKPPIRCPRCLKDYNTIDDFIIHACSKASKDNNYYCARCRHIYTTKDELDRHDCVTLSQYEIAENNKTSKPFNKQQHSKQTKDWQELENRTCDESSIVCNDCSENFPIFEEFISHYCSKPKPQAVDVEVLEDDDCLATLTAIELTEYDSPSTLIPAKAIESIDNDSSTTSIPDISLTEKATATSEIIDIDSDSDIEFIESSINQQPSRVIKEIFPLDPLEASKLISQGIQVVTSKDLQFQPLLLPSLVAIGQNATNDRLPVIENVFSEFNERYLINYSSDERIFLSNGNGENSNIHIWPSVSNTNESSSINSTKANYSTINIEALKETVEKIGLLETSRNSAPSTNLQRNFPNERHFVGEPLKSPNSKNFNGNTLQTLDENGPIGTSNNSVRATNNSDYSLLISDDDETENSQQKIPNDSEMHSFVESKRPNQKTLETNNYICLNDDDDDDDDEAVENEQNSLENNYLQAEEQSETENSNKKIKRPPSAFLIYKDKLKPELDKKCPNLKPKDRMKVTINSWKNLPPAGKWPFMEEARLLRELFRREHPSLCKSKPKPQSKKSAINKLQVTAEIEKETESYFSMPQISSVFTVHENPLEAIIQLD